MSMMLFLISKTLAYRLGETTSGNKLNGIFAFAIYDEENDELLSVNKSRVHL